MVLRAGAISSEKVNQWRGPEEKVLFHSGYPTICRSFGQEMAREVARRNLAIDYTPPGGGTLFGWIEVTVADIPDPAYLNVEVEWDGENVFKMRGATYHAFPWVGRVLRENGMMAGSMYVRIPVSRSKSEQNQTCTEKTTAKNKQESAAELEEKLLNEVRNMGQLIS